LSTENDVPQEEIDAAIIQCLRIFAARGRQLRLQRERERAAKEQADKERAKGENMHLDSDTPIVLADRENEGTPTPSDHASDEL